MRFFVIFLFVLVRRLHAEAQVNGLELMPPLPQLLFQTREDMALEVAALRLHILERGTNEDRASLPLGGCGNFTWHRLSR